MGDLCDPDDDNDDIPDTTDNCRSIVNLDQADEDEDGAGDVCDNCTDTDDDGYGNPGFPDNTCLLDSCPYDPDNDIDNDGVCGDIDNCPIFYNPLQEDTYPPEGDGLGDVCDIKSLLYLDSDEGHWVGQGQRLYYTTNDASFSAEVINTTDLWGVRIYVREPSPGDYWTLWFEAPGEEQLTVGVYEDALRAPFNGDNAGLSVSGQGHGCNELSGSFEVLEFNVHDGVVESFAARFEQHCNFETEAIRGVIYYNFNGPDRDGVLNSEDNCLWTPNGPDGGTCISGAIGNFCIDDDECGGEINSCSMQQEDSYPPGGNGVGDACDCEGDFICDGDVDGTDAALFKRDFGRGFSNACRYEVPCRGDFDCDGDVDGTDVSLLKADFGRNPLNKPCPACTIEGWCVY